MSTSPAPVMRIVGAILVFIGSIAPAFPEIGGSEPVTPLEPGQQLDSRKIELGRRLFNDPKVSRGNVVACASCHDIHAGGADGRVLSIGADGQPLDYNTPTV